VAHRPPVSPKRILCLRLERIGDLLMTLPALADLRASFPDAGIELVVGSWNRELAAAIAGIDRVETLDAEWLARADGRHGLGTLALIRAASRWRSRKYDLALNFEPDIRGNLALAAAGARWTAGFASGGGGAVLDTALEYDTTIHTSDNGRALVKAAAGEHARTGTPVLDIPDANRAEAARLLDRDGFRNGTRRIGIHVSSGRLVKQWPEERFSEVAQSLLRNHGASIVLTGSPADRAQVDRVRKDLPPDRVLDLSNGCGLLTVAAVLGHLELLVTGDTGPMHLAHAVNTPIVAIFGPSQPWRYGPRGLRDRLVRIDLPCSPCNRIRMPPERCTGHIPDCLTGIDTAQVLAAIDEVLAEGTR
jgi:ADP-heptose:LPS heptosyltransferase